MCLPSLIYLEKFESPMMTSLIYQHHLSIPVGRFHGLSPIQVHCLDARRYCYLS